MIAVLLPSNRPNLLAKFLDSAIATVHDHSIVRILVGYDVGHAAVAEVANAYPMAIAIQLPREDSFNLSNAMTYLAKTCEPSFRYFWAMNDDVVIESNDWDVEILKIPDGHLGQGEDFSFPILTRTHLELFGEFFPEQLPGEGADVFVHEVYSSAGLLVQNPEIKTKHNKTQDINDEHFRKVSCWETRHERVDWDAYISRLKKWKEQR